MTQPTTAPVTTPLTVDEIEASLDPEVLDQLRALPIEPGRPLLAIDADEVLVYLAEHLARYLPTIGFRMRLTQYQLEGSIFPAGSDVPVPFDDCLRLIDRFFDEETHNQQAIPGAVEALERLSGQAQVIVLTNVPRHARELRRENLAALGRTWRRWGWVIRWSRTPAARAGRCSGWRPRRRRRRLSSTTR
jgi:hypothetical protein